MSVPVLKTERGFHDYGEPVTDSYGATVNVRESSSAEGPHVWIFVKGGGIEANDGAAHLNEEQARAIIERLQTWVDEIPTRWENP